MADFPEKIDVENALLRVRTTLEHINGKLAAIHDERRLLAQEWPDLSQRQKTSAGHTVIAAREELGPLLEALEILTFQR